LELLALALGSETTGSAYTVSSEDSGVVGFGSDAAAGAVSRSPKAPPLRSTKTATITVAKTIKIILRLVIPVNIYISIYFNIN